MRIVFVLGYPLRTGGHHKSALAMVRQLICMGHSIRVLAPGGVDEMQAQFRATGARVTLLPELNHRQRLPRPFLARQIIREGAVDGEVDLYHAQDTRAAPPTYLAAALAGKPFVLTIAGGPVIRFPLPPRCHTVVFSGELLDGFHDRATASATVLHLIRARIDTGLFHREEVDPAFVEKHGLPQRGWKVVLAMRLAESKRPWLETLLSTARALSHSELDVRFTVAGEGPLLADLRSDAERILHVNSREPMVYPIGPVFAPRDLVQLYNYADVVIGSGRGILEAMACAKPVIVLGERGEGEIIDEKSVNAAAYTNFSGRHFRERVERPRPLADLFREIFGQKSTLIKHGQFSYDYILSEQDARIGAEKLMLVYEGARRDPARLTDYGIWMMRIFVITARGSLQWRLQRWRATEN